MRVKLFESWRASNCWQLSLILTKNGFRLRCACELQMFSQRQSPSLITAFVLVPLVFTLLANCFAFPNLIQNFDSCGCEDKPQLEVLAIVNGVAIRKQDLGADTHNKITVVQNAVVDARNRELDLQINSLLLESEAHARGITAAELLQLEVASKVAPPTEAEAQLLYNQNKDRIGKSFKDSKAELLGFIKNERERLLAQKLANTLRATAKINVTTNIATPPANEADRQKVFATINGRTITSGDIEDSLLPLVFQVQQQVYAYRKEELDLKINDVLLEQEAKKQGLSSRALLDKMVKSQIPIITETQALEFYNENKKKLNSDFERVKFQIIQFLTGQEEKRLSEAFAAQLRRAAAIQVFLTPPESPAFKIAIDDQPVKGDPNAAVTVVQFTDFECTNCAQQFQTLQKLIAEYGNRVRLVIRDFPLAQHENAIKAAEAAEAAREQGRYWEYIDLLYQNQSALQVDKLKEYATSVGLDRKKFDAALDSGRFNGKVQRDIADGSKIGVGTTPVLFVNGRRVADNSEAGLRTAINRAIQGQQ